MSITWYTWLEQGREINPSRQVLDAIARTLQLSPAEHTYVLALAGYAPPQRQSGREPIPSHVQRLLDSLADSPAFAIESDWWIAGWNAAYAALYPNVARIPAGDRNLLWLVFTDSYVRQLLPDWEADSRRFLAEFRAEAGSRLGSPDYIQLIEKLQSASASFRDGWESRDIEGFASRERLFHHPKVGDLQLEHHQLTPADQRGLSLIVYLPVPGTETPDRLRRLLES